MRATTAQVSSTLTGWHGSRYFLARQDVVGVLIAGKWVSISLGRWRIDSVLVGRSPWTARDAPVPLPDAGTHG